jgi:hypothetical protein
MTNSNTILGNLPNSEWYDSEDETSERDDSKKVYLNSEWYDSEDENLESIWFDIDDDELNNSKRTDTDYDSPFFDEPQRLKCFYIIQLVN